MGIASRKTWLEKQSDEVQLLVLSLDDEGRKLEEIQAAVLERWGKKVPHSTLHRSLQKYANTVGREERLVALLAQRHKKFFRDNPEIDPHSIVRYHLTIQAAKIKAADLPAEFVASASQTEAWIALRARELEIKQAANQLRREQFEMLKTRIAQAREKLTQVVQDEKATPTEVRNRIREIYGLFDEPAGVAGRGASPPLSGTVGAR